MRYFPAVEISVAAQQRVNFYSQKGKEENAESKREREEHNSEYVIRLLLDSAQVFGETRWCRCLSFALLFSYQQG